MSTTFSQALASASSLGLKSLDAELLLLFNTGRQEKGRAWLRANQDTLLDLADKERFFETCQRRLNGEPLAYITGHRGFYGLALQIDSRVLDPRPDTETLVDWALDVLRLTQQPRVVDLGVGSGAIALAIQHERPDAQLVAVDVSPDALAVASANATRLKLPVRFIHGSWLTPLHSSASQADTENQTNTCLLAENLCFDLIVSNPPYIAEGDPHLPALQHEPIMALTSGPDGLDAIRHIVHGAPRALRPGGWLLLEHGYDQGEAVDALLRARGFSDITSKRDLSDHVRCTGGRWWGAHTADNQGL